MTPLRFLRDLNPRRTSALFFAALVAGTGLILPNWGALWVWVVMPVIPIVLYGGALWVSQAHFLVSHTSAIKSSPYILGFTLTLIALFNLFLRGGNELVTGTVDQDLLLGQVGAAIATTAVGLVTRQVLITHDFQEEDQHRVFQSLATQLRENARDFDSAQRQLISLIKEFVATREELFSQEEQAFQRFLSGLDSGSQILTEIETTYPKRLQSALATIEDHLLVLDGAVTGTTRNLAELCTTAKRGNEEVQSSASAILIQLSESSGKWAEASQAAINGLDTSRRTLRNQVEAVRELREKLDGVVHSFEQLPAQISEAMMHWGAKSRANHDELADLFSGLLADVRAMDVVVDEVASLLSKRVANFKNE